MRYESNNPSKPLDPTDSKVTHWGFSRQKNKPLAVEVPVEWEEPEEVHPRPRPVHHQHPQVDTFVVHPPPKSHQHRPPPVRPLPPANTGWTTPPPPPMAAWSTPSPHSHPAPRPRPHVPSAPTVPVLSTDGWKPMPPHPPEKPKAFPPVTSFKGQPGFQFYDSRLASTPSPSPPAYRPIERPHPPSKPSPPHEQDDPVVYKPNVHHPFLEPDPEIPSYVGMTTKPPLHPLYPIHEYHDKSKPYYQLVPAHLTNQSPQSAIKKPHSGFPGGVVVRPKPQHPHDQHDTMIRPEDYEYMEAPTPPPNIYNSMLLNKRPPYPPPPHVDYTPDDGREKRPERPKYPHSGYPPPTPVTSEPQLNRKPGQVTAYQDPLPLPPSYRPTPTQVPNVYEDEKEPLQVETPSRRPGQLSVYKKPYTQPPPDYERPQSYPTEAPEFYNERPKPRPTPFTAYNKRPPVSYSTTTEYPLRQAPKPWIPVPSTTEIPQHYEQEEDEPVTEPPKRRPPPPIKSFRPKQSTTTTTTTTTTEYPLMEAPEEVIDDSPPPPPPPTKRRPHNSPSIKPFRPKQRPSSVESPDETESTTRRPPYRPVSKKPLPERYDAGHQNVEKPIRKTTTTTTTTTTTRTPKIYQSSVDDEVIERPRKKVAKKQPNQDTATEILNRLKLKHTVMDNFGMRTQPLTHTEESRTKQTFLPSDVELIETDDEARIILRKGNKYKMADLDVLQGEANVVLNEQLLYPADTPEFQEFHSAGDVPKMSEMKETLAELKAKVLSTTTTTGAPDYEAASVRSLNTTRKAKRKGVRRRNQSVATSRIAKRKNVVSVAKKNNETTTAATTTKAPLILVRLPSKVRVSQQTNNANKEKAETKN